MTENDYANDTATGRSGRGVKGKGTWGRLNNGIGADWYDIPRGTRSQHQQHRLRLARVHDMPLPPATFIGISLFYYVATERRPGRTISLLLAYNTRLPSYGRPCPSPLARSLTYRPRHARTGAPREIKRGGGDFLRVCIGEKR